MIILLQILGFCVLLAIFIFMYIGLDGYYKDRDEYRRRTGKYYYNGADDE